MERKRERSKGAIVNYEWVTLRLQMDTQSKAGTDRETERDGQRDVQSLHGLVPIVNVNNG